MGFFPAGSSSSGGGGLQPYQFQPETYGALGNGKIVGDVVTNSTTTITSATAGFTAADAGKAVMINGANGTTSGPLITTISSVSNSTTVILASAATASQSGCSMVWGTDDTAAVNSCLTAMSTYAQANDFFAEMFLSAKLYCLASGPTQFGNGSSTPTFNSQIPLPFPNANGSTRKLVLSFRGAGDAAASPYFQATTPNVQGSAFVSMVQAPASGGSGTFGAQSVIGGPSAGSGTGAFGFTGGFANVLATVNGVTVVVPWGAQQIGMDFRFVASMSVPNASVLGFAPVLGTSPLLSDISHWANTNAVGLYAPITLNNDDVYIDQFTVNGLAGVGAVGAEHFTASKLTLISCNQGLGFRPGSGTAVHGAAVLYCSVENTHTALIVFNSFGGALYPVNIALLDTEVIDTSDINDPSNQLTGVVHWADFERTNMNVTGAGNLKIINDRLGPGHTASPPAVPATTVAATLVFRDASVVVHTGAGVTVSAITVDGTATSQTVAASSSSVPIWVPSGKTIALTYAGGTPTWDWWLD